MQNAIFVIKPDGSYAYFVRGSLQSAKENGVIEQIFPMISYKDLLEFVGSDCKNVYIESEVMTHAMIMRLKKYFDIQEIMPMDDVIFKARSVKSEHELSLMREAGRQHQHLMETIVPAVLEEGMSEAKFTAVLYDKMIEMGYHGVTRFAMFQIEMIIGQIGFGESSLYPTSFDSPGGNVSICPAVQTAGSRDRLLKKGDLVFVDIGYGVGGYHTDKTQLFMFGAKPSSEVMKIQSACLDIQKRAAEQLKTGNIPEKIYADIMGRVDASVLPNFMGFGSRLAKFIGHGVGLHVDEYPVIAKGFTEPLQKNMTIALEPKNGLAGVGLLGVEDTYLVTDHGGEPLTGGGREIIVV